MDYSELRGRIRAKLGTQGAFAEAMGMDPSTLSLKLNGQRQWTVDEVLKACELLDIELANAHEYFFCAVC